MMGSDIRWQPSSFRDPSGFVFYYQEEVYRQINVSYKKHYDHFITSGLYERLRKEGLILEQKEIEVNIFSEFLGEQKRNCYKIVRPDTIPFISYPYEWCLSQLKDAALITIKVQKVAMEYGMFLKDASAFNIQFHKGKLVLIDLLSFEIYKEGVPWVAYQQFCQHFLAPLTLARYNHPSCLKLMQIFLDGVPLELATALLPLKTYRRFNLLTNIFLHNLSQKKYQQAGQANYSKRKINKQALGAIIESLEKAIQQLNHPKKNTVWSEYYQATNYSSEAFAVKKEIIENWLREYKPKRVWDLGANTGEFSRLASNQGLNTIAFDVDELAVEKNYLLVKKNQETKLLPLVMDLTSPSPALGWHNKERNSLIERGPADMILALALIHHLVIANNTPLALVAEFFSVLAPLLIIEFISKNDSNVQRLLASREDIFSDYNEENFEKIFGKLYNIRSKKPIINSQRILYLMQRK